MHTTEQDLRLAEQLRRDHDRLMAEIGKVIIGQDEIVRQVLISIFSNGHCLLVGVPGLAKTLLVQTIAKALNLSFNRIQFTPDLMPSDITGSEILDESKTFRFIQGPLFSNLILADEINRTPPKTQAALLEAMQERHITVAGKMYSLPSPFFVLATQNPIEQEGTYPLPEAQLDRFMFNIRLDYPSFEDELKVVKATTGNLHASPEVVLEASDILAYQQLVRKVPVADNVLEYAVQLTHKTRRGKPGASPIAQDYLTWGAGPRASQYLIIGAKCHALLFGKLSPDIEDVKAVALPILRHRIMLTYKAESAGLSPDDIIRQLL